MLEKKNVGWALASVEDYDLLSKYNFHLNKGKTEIVMLTQK